MIVIAIAIVVVAWGLVANRQRMPFARQSIFKTSIFSVFPLSPLFPLVGPHGCGIQATEEVV